MEGRAERSYSPNAVHHAQRATWSLLWKQCLWEPSCLAFLCTNWSGRMQHPQTQQIDMGSPVHLALEILQSGNLPFDLSRTPGLGEGRLNGF